MPNTGAKSGADTDGNLGKFGLKLVGLYCLKGETYLAFVVKSSSLLPII